jgi:hypothetical protein
MTRNDILDQFEISEHDKVKDIIDYFEDEFAKINELLDIDASKEIEQVNKAKEIAEINSDNLY